MQFPQLHIEITQPILRLCRDHTVAVWFSSILRICVPNMYNYSFLIEMALQTYKTKYSMRETLSQTLTHPKVAARSWWGCRTMTAQYSCHFTVSALTLCGNLGIATWGLYDYPKSLQSMYDFLFQNDHLKSCVLCMIMGCTYNVSEGFQLFFMYNAELNKTVEVMATLPRPWNHKTICYCTVPVRRL